MQASSCMISLLCEIHFGSLHSVSIIPSQMWVALAAYIPQLYLGKICSNNLIYQRILAMPFLTSVVVYNWMPSSFHIWSHTLPGKWFQWRMELMYTWNDIYVFSILSCLFCIFVVFFIVCYYVLCYSYCTLQPEYHQKSERAFSSALNIHPFFSGAWWLSELLQTLVTCVYIYQTVMKM